MHKAETLHNTLCRIDGRGYKAYKELKGSYAFPDFTLYIDHVQGDPFAAPSRIRVRVERKKAGWPENLAVRKEHRIAVGDFLARECGQAIKRIAKGKRGSGASGQISLDQPGQEVLERTSVIVEPAWIEARLTIGLPAAGRQVLGREAAEIFFRELPAIVKESIFFSSLDQQKLTGHWQTYEEAEFIREKLPAMGLVSFIANGSVLPRRSGVDEWPIRREEAVSFLSPPELEVAIDLPYSGRMTGMGIPQGITLIVGGGYHGKSTLLRAIERGIYNHIPGDGREYVVTIGSAVKIRAEDGRAVTKVDISAFINNLPHLPGRPAPDTSGFTTVNASGSTSQAANICEALEIGAELLLLDEDTSATNFMIRDERMQELVAKEKEPITPYLERIVQLKEAGISTILALGGSGAYFDLADTVIMMDSYHCRAVTEEAKRICRVHPIRGHKVAASGSFSPKSRIPLPQGLDPSIREKVKIKTRGINEIGFGLAEIDLSAVEQIVDEAQVRFIGETMYFLAKNLVDGRRSLREILLSWEELLESGGLDQVARTLRGDFARPRRFEVAAALNRLRTLKIRP